MHSGPQLTPKQYIHFYNDVEWEEFVVEWANAIDSEYHQVKRLGGAYDRGADVAGLCTSQGFEGPWDCFQCKHYKEALTPTDIWPEILKLLVSVIAGHYILPRRYVFLAPRQCGNSLNFLLSSPSKLRAKFIEQTAPNKPLTKKMEVDLLYRVRNLAHKIDFSIFEAAKIDDVLEVHSKTRYHSARFRTDLPGRPASQQPPPEVQPDEARFVEQLMEVYREQYPEQPFTPIMALDHERTGLHFRRQRVSFYCAESLRMYARDSVPEGTFESLQDDVYSGVIETAERDFPRGVERLTSVLEAAIQLSLTANALITRSDPTDRKGICHQLANDDRLIWCRGRQS